jgi:hypothetical protein
MPGTFIAHNGMVDISFVWPDILVAKAQEIIGGAALYLHSKGYGPTIVVGEETVQKPFADLSNQEKLTIVFAYTQHMIVEQAKSALVDTDVGVAREEAIAYADENYQLE